jgi:hypothetical protein
LKISGGDDGAHEPIPNNQNEFAARVTDSEGENDNLSIEKGVDLINEEVTGVEDTVSKENPLAMRGNDDKISDEESRSQLDGENEADEDTESQIPSGILRFILEH